MGTGDGGAHGVQKVATENMPFSFRKLIEARVGGKSWSEPGIVSGDSAGGDLGYPSTVQLNDGSLVSVWYERRAKSSFAVLAHS